MLYLSRKPGEGVKIGEQITIIVWRDPKNSSRIKLCIDSPELPVYRLDNRAPQVSGNYASKE